MVIIRFIQILLQSLSLLVTQAFQQHTASSDQRQPLQYGLDRDGLETT